MVQTGLSGREMQLFSQEIMYSLNCGLLLRGLDVGKKAIVRILPEVEPPRGLGAYADGVLRVGGTGAVDTDDYPRELPTTEQLVTQRGFPIESHRTFTSDGYGICLHRIPKHGNPVVLLWHGLLMSSESWVCIPDPGSSLAFELARRGYDVWLGNTRGNRYSNTHVTLPRTSKKYWDFSIDEIAKYDFPSSVNFILSHTKKKTLSYVAFSQGSTQGFASLSTNMELNEKINLFVALAPAAKPNNFPNRLLSMMVNSSPESLYTILGERSFIGASGFLRRMLPSHTYTMIVSLALQYIFGWKGKSLDNKDILYSHLYSQSSVKQVVHWLQIIRKGEFRSYELSPSSPPPEGAPQASEEYCIHNITTPIAIIYGKDDKLIDVDWLIQRLQTIVMCKGLDAYEHLCILWGRDVKHTVNPDIIGLLESYSPIQPIPSSGEIPSATPGSAGSN